VKWSVWANSSGGTSARGVGSKEASTPRRAELARKNDRSSRLAAIGGLIADALARRRAKRQGASP
jgi:hypothetical protein